MESQREEFKIAHMVSLELDPLKICHWLKGRETPSLSEESEFAFVKYLEVLTLTPCIYEISLLSLLQ